MINRLTHSVAGKTLVKIDLSSKRETFIEEFIEATMKIDNIVNLKTPNVMSATIFPMFK